VRCAQGQGESQPHPPSQQEWPQRGLNLHPACVGWDAHAPQLGKLCPLFGWEGAKYRLSPHFFAKRWTQKELAGLTAREVSGEKVILPVWHNITAEQVRKYSPTLADRVAVSSDRGLEHVVEELLRVIRPASEPKVQSSPEVAQILRRYEGERIKANREDKPDQYFVCKGLLHYLDEGAAQVCEERIGAPKDLDPDEEFILDIQEIRGSPYNRLKMIEVLAWIEAEEIERSGK
jgi:hypothetical protein